MHYVKLDTIYYQDDRMLQVGEAAELLYVRSLCLAKTLLTDGSLTKQQVQFCGLSDIEERAEALVKSGLWTPISGGWQITSWLKHNEAAKYVKSKQKAKQEAGKKGGIESAKSRQAKKKEAPASSNNGKVVEPTGEPIVEKSRVEYSREEEDLKTSSFAASGAGDQGQSPEKNEGNSEGSEEPRDPWMSKMVEMWSELPGVSKVPFGFLGKLRQVHGEEIPKRALEGMWCNDWEPAEGQSGPRARQSYLTKICQEKSAEEAAASDHYAGDGTVEGAVLDFREGEIEREAEIERNQEYFEEERRLKEERNVVAQEKAARREAMG